MRRSVLALIGTVAGTALMVGAKLGTHPGTQPDPAALDTAPSGEPASAAPPSTSTPSGSAAPKPGATSTKPAPPTTPAAGGLKNGTFTGAGAAAKRYETVTVTITVSGGKITAVNGSCGNASGESRSICQGALPKLQQEALTAQSAKIASVSGATATWTAYKTSLQSALDQAKA
jgi:uncharacterized protein with FMN-binding domain